MPDPLTLSLWIRGFREETLPDCFEKVLRAFPFSRLRPGLSALRVYAIEFVEPAVFEHLLTAEAAVEDVLELAAEFRNPDCAYVVEGWWDLWQYTGDWQLTPARVSISCYGPDFENELGDNFRLELGPDTLFLPDPAIPDGVRKVHSNLQSVVRLAGDLAAVLPVARRRLWSESGENFAERLDEAVSEDRF